MAFSSYGRPASRMRQPPLICRPPAGQHPDLRFRRSASRSPPQGRPSPALVHQRLRLSPAGTAESNPPEVWGVEELLDHFKVIPPASKRTKGGRMVVVFAVRPRCS